MSEDLLDKDVESLLREKIAYHRAQARMHVKMANDTKNKLAVLSGNSIPKTVKEIEAQMVEETNNIPQSDLSFSVPVWKPRVERVLRNSPIPLKTEEILKQIDARYLENDNIRRQAIGIISSSLFALGEKGLVQKIPIDGRGNAYKWIQ